MFGFCFACGFFSGETLCFGFAPGFFLCGLARCFFAGKAFGLGFAACFFFSRTARGFFTFACFALDPFGFCFACGFFSGQTFGLGFSAGFVLSGLARCRVARSTFGFSAAPRLFLGGRALGFLFGGFARRFFA